MSKQSFLNNPYFFLILGLALFFPAYLINLGDQPIIEDESIRSLVAFEMVKSGDYITPTIGGDPYLRKPPLYNWLIAGSFKLFGNYSEVAVRMPMVISTFFFALTIFFFVKREFGTRMGVINALIFITVGRIIVYESLHGLIDIAFSWLTYLFFMTSYVFFKKQRYLLLFTSAYLITSVTWLMKGIPGVVFLGISLLVLFISNKKFKMLFNWRHFVGMLLFILIVGGYYLIYFSRNNISPEELFTTLIGQTTRRTVIRFGWLVTLKHLFNFPFEMLYHFLPWTILLVLFFIRGSFKKIRSHPFLKYNFLLLIFNIILYWTSPEVHPRYILMLLPLFFTLVTWIYFKHFKENNRIINSMEILIGVVLVIACIAPFLSYFNELTNAVDHLIISAIILSVFLSIITIYYWKKKPMRLFWLAIAILIMRIGFDFIILPTRQIGNQEVRGKQSAIEVATKTWGKTLKGYWNPDFEPHFYYNRNSILFRYHYHLSVARDEIVYNTSEKVPGVLYFSYRDHIEGQPINIVGEVAQGLDASKPLPLFEFVITGQSE